MTETRQNLSESEHPIPHPAVTARRKELRYQFAQLLAEGRLDTASEEANRAYEGGEILDRDLRFVREIAEGARLEKVSGKKAETTRRHLTNQGQGGS